MLWHIGLRFIFFRKNDKNINSQTQNSIEETKFKIIFNIFKAMFVILCKP